MEKETVLNAVKDIVLNLIWKNYREVVEKDTMKLIPAKELQIAIEEYPGSITMPPDNAFDKMDIYVINDKTIAVDMDLWYDDKQSDLTLSCKIMENGGKIGYSIENVHIL